jgi:2'-hydroxyisoflavone reductase
LAQLAQNKQVVAPGDGSDPVEIVDVRDVAAWIVQNVEARRTGVYNVCGRPTPFRAFLQESGSAIHGGAQLVWIDQKFLLKEGVHAGDNMPYWMPDSPAFAQFSSMKARRAGWITRPLKETAADAWKSYCTRIDPNLPYPQHQWRYNWGISAERQTQILQNWKNRQRSIS